VPLKMYVFRVTQKNFLRIPNTGDFVWKSALYTLIETVKRFENGWAMIKIADGTLGWIVPKTKAGPLIAVLDGQPGCNE